MSASLRYLPRPHFVFGFQRVNGEALVSAWRRNHCRGQTKERQRTHGPGPWGLGPRGLNARARVVAAAAAASRRLCLTGPCPPMTPPFPPRVPSAEGTGGARALGLLDDALLPLEHFGPVRVPGGEEDETSGRTQWGMWARGEPWANRGRGWAGRHASATTVPPFPRYIHFLLSLSRPIPAPHPALSPSLYSSNPLQPPPTPSYPRSPLGLPPTAPPAPFPRCGPTRPRGAPRPP